MAADAAPAACNRTDRLGSGPAGGYTPADLAAAYGYDTDATPPTPQVIGIVDWYDDPKAWGNLNAFDKCYGLPTETSQSFRKVSETESALELPKADADSAVEITLDIQSVRAVCHACPIVLVEASGPMDNDLAKARTKETVWNEDGIDDAAGLSKRGGALGATGGGCSNRFAAQKWQSDYANYAKSNCKGHRLAADVSAIADPATGLDIYDTFKQPGWITVGGTSLASPVTAAMFALAGGSGGAAYPASSLYVNAAQRAASVHDVVATSGTTSGNSFCGGASTAGCAHVVATGTNHKVNNPNALGWGLLDCSFPHKGAKVSKSPTRSRECNTTRGLDGPTGLGTPNSLALFTSTAPDVETTWPTAVPHGDPQTFTSTATEQVAGAQITSYQYNFGDGAAANGPTVRHTFAPGPTRPR